MGPVGFSLSDLEWRLAGWRPWEWNLPLPIEAPDALREPDIGPVAAVVPGSVRGALVRAGVVKPADYARDSVRTEFIENRHWVFSTVLPGDVSVGRKVLRLGLVDGPCIVRFEGKEVGKISNGFVPHEIELFVSGALAPVLELIFLESPQGLSQIGRTSEITSLKPRFTSGWDWVPRIVHVGVAHEARLFDIQERTRVDLRVDASLTGNAGVIEIECDLVGGGWTPQTISVLDPRGLEVVRQEIEWDSERRWIGSINIENPERWSTSSPALYSLLIEGASPKRLGFRTLEWSSGDSISSNAEPWLLSENHDQITIVGVNWVPIRPDYSDVSNDEYDLRLIQYKSLGFNLIRVWGGAGRERDYFYDRCDELGIYVWQDLPLSSSGIDNEPPRTEAFAARYREIADSYVRELAHHPCLAVLCGGNELAYKSEGRDTPLGFENRVLNELNESVGERASRLGWKVVPTTPSGPRYTADESEFGLELHHDVHGPWAHNGSDADWNRYWANDDALLRSEVGIAGASPFDLLEAYGLVPSSPEHTLQLWRHSAKWWLTGEEEATEAWVQWSQERQARLLARAAQESIRRRCGIIFWLGHDTFPAPVSLSLLDYWGRPKPAAIAVSNVIGMESPSANGAA